MRTEMPSSLEIAQGATLRPIEEIAAAAGLVPEEVEPYGRTKAKIDLGVLERLRHTADGKLICVTAITPTKAGEGKTTTSVSLTQGLGHIGRKSVLCLREASLGPVFGIKGGAAGGGYSQVIPMEDFNLHLTGDVHAASVVPVASAYTPVPGGVGPMTVAALIANTVLAAERLDNPVKV